VEYLVSKEDKWEVKYFDPGLQEFLPSGGLSGKKKKPRREEINFQKGAPQSLKN